MKYFIDTEFDGHTGGLLSLGMVREDDYSIHIEVDVAATDLWVIRNVLPLMWQHEASKSVKVYHNEVGTEIRRFFADDLHPVIIADSPVDIARFCTAISTGEDGQWVSADYPRLTFEVHNVDCYPTTLPGAVQHNAWWDAMALRHKLAEGPRVDEWRCINCKLVVRKAFEPERCPECRWNAGWAHVAPAP